MPPEITEIKERSEYLALNILNLFLDLTHHSSY